MISKAATALALSSLLWIHSAAAEQVDCKPHPTLTGDKGVVSLNGAISAGDHLPVGAILYQFDYTAQNAESLECSSPLSVWPFGEVDFTTEVRLTGAYTLVNGITGDNNAPIYETNIPGIGVYYLANGRNPLPYRNDISPKVKPTSNNAPGSQSPNQLSLRVRLIKTGPISHGTVNGSSLPSVQSKILAPTKYPQHIFTGLPVDTSLINLSGQLQVQKPSCTIKDKNTVVQLGSHDVSTFTGSGSVLQWIDASIELVDCEQFVGRWGSGANNPAIIGPGTLPLPQYTEGTAMGSINIEVTSASGVIDPLHGIINIVPGATSATGVGIQLALDWGFNQVTISFGSALPFRFTAGRNVKIPLLARYIQTENTVSAGRADGAIVYNITYY